MTDTIVEPSGTYIFHTSEGEILGSVTNMTLSLAVLNKPEDCTLMEVPVETEITPDVYMVEGVITPRPASAILPTTGVAPLIIDLSVLAAGTSLTLTNETDQSMEITDISEELNLTDVGRYTLHAVQPFPYKNIYQEIIVA
jgi:hypothetical protein